MTRKPLAAHPVFDPSILGGIHLLEADAGTGKTWTITGLIMRALIERDLPIGSILAVTFTRAAVAELRKRIRARLALLLEHLKTGVSDRSLPAGDPFCEEYANRIRAGSVSLQSDGTPVTPASATAALRRALAHIDELPVFTIHGFCQRLLSEQTLSTDSPAKIELSADARGLLGDEVATWWRDHIAVLPASGIQTIGLCGVRLAHLQAAVGWRLQYADARVRPAAAGWPALLASADAARRALGDAIGKRGGELIARVGEGINGPAKIDGRRLHAVHASSALDELRNLCSDPLYPGTWPVTELDRLSLEKFAKAGAVAAAVEALQIPRRCTELLDIINHDLNGLLASMSEAAAGEVYSRLVRAHNESGVLGYDDLLRLARRALEDPERGPALAEKLRQRYPLALMDECQDTDGSQWAILQRIYPMQADTALILVGDPKQAIYAFRGADVYAYLAVREGWPAGAAEAEVSAQGLADIVPRLHRLDENQRSVTGLIDAVNALFDQPDAFRIPEIEFAPAAAGARDVAPLLSSEQALGLRARAPLCWIECTDRDGQADMPDRKTAETRVAQAAAAEIARLLAPSGASVAGKPLQADQISVLVHRNDQATLVKRELAKLGLSAAELGRDNVLASREAGELERIIAAIDEPANVAAVKGALATMTLGVVASELDHAVQDRADAFELARERWLRRGPQHALRSLLDEFDGAARLARLPDGERRLTNLLHLFELLADSPQAAAGPAQALRWQGRQRSGDGDPDARELRLASDENLIRIVTIHKSKGLEYAVVFVPFAWMPPRQLKKNPIKSGRPALYHEHDQHWRAILDLSMHLDAAAQLRLVQEDRAQSLRLLYVAVTRARQRCYLFNARVKGSEDSALGWLLSGGAATAGTGSTQLAPRFSAIRSQVAILSADDLLPAPARAVPASARGPGLALRTFDARLSRSWVRSSYSSIARSLEGEDEADVAYTRDHDQPIIEAATVTEDRETAREDSSGGKSGREFAAVAKGAIRFDFPASSHAGACLHQVFEASDFAAGVQSSTVSKVLVRHGFDAALARPTRDWLDEVLHAPLGPAGIRLADVKLPDRLTELEFRLSARGLKTADLVAAIARRYPLAGTVDAERWSGYLEGFIDLVFRRDGRYYIVDWKSNRLGAKFADYGQAGMTAAVAQHAYALQFSLYSLALHRFLAGRLNGYDFNQHFGGVFYLFVRGVKSGVGDASGGPCGVYFVEPDAGTIAELDRLFEGRVG